MLQLLYQHYQQDVPNRLVLQVPLTRHLYTWAVPRQKQFQSYEKAIYVLFVVTRPETQGRSIIKKNEKTFLHLQLIISIINYKPLPNQGLGAIIKRSSNKLVL